MNELMNSKKSLNNHKAKPAAKRITAKQADIITIRTDNPSMTNQQIADAAQTSVGYVSDILQRYNLNKEAIDQYNSNKSTIWNGVSSRILSFITDKDIQKASLQQKITAAGIAYDKASEASGNSKVIPMVTINMISPNPPVEVIDVKG